MSRKADFRAEKHAGKGYSKYSSGKYNEAITEYDEAIHLQPNYVLVFLKRGNAKRMLGQYQNAITDYDQAIQLTPNISKEIQQYLEEERENKRRDEEKRQEHQARWKAGEEKLPFFFPIRITFDTWPLYLRNLSDYRELFFNRADCKRRLVDFRGAIADYDQLIKIDSEDIGAYCCRGYVKNQLGEKKAALVDYEQVIRLASPETAIRVDIRGKWENAYSLALNERGTIKMTLSDLSGAMVDFEELIRNQPTAEIWCQLAQVKMKLNNREGAITDYTQAISLDSQCAEAFYRRGCLQSQLGRHAEAYADFCNAGSFNYSGESAPEYWFEQGYYAKEGIESWKDLTRTEKFFDNAIKLKPNYAEAFYEKGLLKKERYEGQYKPQEAIENYDQAIRFKPDYTEAWHERGLEKMSLEDYQGAIVDFKQAAHLKPNFSEAHRALEEAKNARRLEVEAQEETRREERKVQEEMRKKQEADTEIANFSQKLKDLKIKSQQPNCSLSDVNHHYQALERQAILQRSADFYMTRGNFYYFSAKHDSEKIRQQKLYQKSLDDYQQALDYDPFMDGIVEKIQELNTLLGTAQKSSSAVHGLFKPPVAQSAQPAHNMLDEHDRAEIERIKARLRQEAANGHIPNSNK